MIEIECLWCVDTNVFIENYTGKIQLLVTLSRPSYIRNILSQFILSYVSCLMSNCEIFLIGNAKNWFWWIVYKLSEADSFSDKVLKFRLSRFSSWKKTSKEFHEFWFVIDLMFWNSYLFHYLSSVFKCIKLSIQRLRSFLSIHNVKCLKTQIDNVMKRPNNEY